MRRIRYSVAMSLDGYIAGPDDEFDWITVDPEIDFEAIFSGDIGFPAEQHLSGLVGSVEVLKVGHHGSDGSTGAAWLEELSPRVSIVSVGNNRYGHPTAGALERLSGYGSSVWRTDELGPITIRTDGHEILVSARGRKERLIASPD